MTEKKEAPASAGTETRAEKNKPTTIISPIQNEILDGLLDMFEKHVCGRCDAKYMERGARTKYGLQITPDEYTCPVDFNFDEPGCAYSWAWKEVTELAGYMADVIGG